MARAPRRRFRTGRDDRGAQGQVKLGEERGSVRGVSKKHGAQSAERRGTPSGRKGLIITPHAPHARPLGCALRESFRALMARGLCPKSLSPIRLKVYNTQVKTTPPWVLRTGVDIITVTSPLHIPTALQDAQHLSKKPRGAVLRPTATRRTRSG
jgi:hypothetical protein